MLAGSDSSRGDLDRAWQEVGSAFASSIALRAQRLTAHIQRQCSEHLYFGHGVFRPLWVPDFGAFTSAHWAQRLVSHLYGLSHPLWSTLYGAPPLWLEPSSFVWFQRGRARRRGWSDMPDENLPIDTGEGAWPEAAPYMPDSYMLNSVEFSQPTVPQKGGSRSILSGRDIGATPVLKPPWKGTAVLLDAGGRASGIPVLSRGYGEVSAMKRYDRLGEPIRPAMATNRLEESLARAQKSLAFIHRILAVPTNMLWAEEVIPPSLSAVETGARRLLGIRNRAMTTTRQEASGGFDKPMPWRPTSASGFTEQTLLPQASQYIAPTEFVLPHDGSPSAQVVPISGHQSPAETAGIGATGAGEQLSTLMGGGRSDGGGPPRGLALAPLGRPKSGGSNSSTMAEPGPEEAVGGRKGLEEPTQPDLDRLARDVYAILKRRFAWEKERSLALR